MSSNKVNKPALSSTVKYLMVFVANETDTVPPEKAGEVSVPTTTLDES
jgi:hypothetical protein